MIRRLFRRRPDAARITWSLWSALQPERPLLATVTDCETGETLITDTHDRIAEWLEIHGYRPVTGPTGIHVRDVPPALRSPLASQQCERVTPAGVKAATPGRPFQQETAS